MTRTKTKTKMTTKTRTDLAELCDWLKSLAKGRLRSYAEGRHWPSYMRDQYQRDADRFNRFANAVAEVLVTSDDIGRAFDEAAAAIPVSTVEGVWGESRVRPDFHLDCEGNQCSQPA